VYSRHRRALWLLLLVAIVLTPFHGSAGETVESHQYRYMMGTSIEVQAFGGDEATRRAAIDEAFAAFAEIDRLMSNYRDDSELALLNRNGARDAVTVSEPNVSRYSRPRAESARRPNGAFDITVGPLVRLGVFMTRLRTSRRKRSSRACGRSWTIVACCSTSCIARRILRGRASSSIWAASRRASPSRSPLASSGGRA
jgi:thiamine biosynthesis lipoprotein